MNLEYFDRYLRGLSLIHVISNVQKGRHQLARSSVDVSFQDISMRKYNIRYVLLPRKYVTTNDMLQVDKFLAAHQQTVRHVCHQSF